jgi:hypothetical protein
VRLSDGTPDEQDLCLQDTAVGGAACAEIGGAVLWAHVYTEDPDAPARNVTVEYPGTCD